MVIVEKTPSGGGAGGGAVVVTVGSKVLVNGHDLTDANSSTSDDHYENIDELKPDSSKKSTGKTKRYKREWSERLSTQRNYLKILR